MIFNIFLVPFGHLYIFFGKLSIRIFWLFLSESFVILSLSCKTSLYILGTMPLLDILFKNISSYNLSFHFLLKKILFIYF